MYTYFDPLVPKPKPTPQVGVGLVLPSASSADDLVKGKEGALPRVVFHWVGRSVLIGTGLAVAGARGKKLIGYSLAGGAAIEFFVLAYAAFHKKDAAK